MLNYMIMWFKDPDEDKANAKFLETARKQAELTIEENESEIKKLEANTQALKDRLNKLSA